MVRFTLLCVAVITAFFAGAEAGLCRPSTTAVTSAAVTTTTSIDATTTLAATTTTVVLGYVETQLFVNPGFDDSDSGYAPWTGNAVIIQRDPQAGTQALYSPDIQQRSKQCQRLRQADPAESERRIRILHYYRVVVARTGLSPTCDLQIKIGGDTTVPANIDLVVGDWKSGSLSWSSAGETIAQADVELAVTCRGDYDRIQINLDSFAFTRVCSA
ncbi:uncharacterized protein FPRO_07036 [Fusarium proliferatum ET1]|uniref:Uncharacterized protein n=1 Tax=Fusarium proliferatum (strain ET1) TaxID=1227346 RepID=A0A1L7VAK4_FUSPR|nr:uncharacterized protein FPRO_07036 [Fusarium proliferatum ET1]CZR37773.1 uncharacterized protein FPRO_07036 [Fusarium proliferatum ET1]